MAETLHLKVWSLPAHGNSFLKGSIFVLAVLPCAPAQMLSRWLLLGSFLQFFLAISAVWSLGSCTYLPSRQILLCLLAMAKCIFQGKLFALSTRKPQWLLHLASLYPFWGMSKGLSQRWSSSCIYSL